MKNSKAILLFILVIQTAFCALMFTIYEKQTEKLIKNNKVLQEEVRTLDENNCIILNLLELTHSKLLSYTNHVTRMQLIAGVINPDSLFSYKEKVLNPIKFNQLNKSKL